ncbi:MAG: MGMT family protein [bacterium]|nr:MGMT family protein [bacterium]
MNIYHRSNFAPTFTARVYQVLRRVPRGKVTTYAALARAVGRPGASRAVGNAMNRNPFPSAPLRAGARTVPCHRVVRSDGMVGGFARGTKRKIKMLKREGVKIEQGKIDLKRFGYKLLESD